MLSTKNSTPYMNYPRLSKEMHKTYLSFKSNTSIPFKMILYCIIIFILFCLIILIDNQYNRLNTPQIQINNTNTINKSISINKESPIDIETWRIVENNGKYAINSNPNISDPIYIPLNKPWGHIYKPT
eukprot:767917_1